MHAPTHAPPRAAQIFKEMQRVLKPGGVAYMSFSNRCFPTKATSLWTSTSDVDHVREDTHEGLRASLARDGGAPSMPSCTAGAHTRFVLCTPS